MKPNEIDKDGVASLTGERAAWILSLDAKPGSTFRAGLIDGATGSATVTSLSEQSVTVKCLFDQAATPPPVLSVILAMPRPKALKRILRTAGEFGLKELILVNANFVEPEYFGSHLLEEKFSREILIQGMSQSGTTHMPRISIHRRLRPFVEDEIDTLFNEETKILAHPAPEPTPCPFPSDGKHVVAIGPERGWIPWEIEMFQRAGFSLFSLGGKFLRTETAFTVAAGLFALRK